MTLPLRGITICTLAAGLSSCSLQQMTILPDGAAVATETSPAVTPLASSFLLDCMAENSPALLLKAEDAGKPREYQQDADLDPVFTVPCRVLCSHQLPLNPGELVLLSVPSGPSGDESGPAERTRFWFLYGPPGEEWMPVPHPDLPGAFKASALDFHGFDAESLLLSVRDSLRGVWKDMADRMNRERPGLLPKEA